MKNIEKGSIKHLVVLVIAYIILGLILYPVLDFIYCKLITHNEFIYSVQADVIKPVTICFVMGMCSWVAEKNIKEK